MQRRGGQDSRVIGNSDKADEVRMSMSMGISTQEETSNLESAGDLARAEGGRR